MNTGDDVIFNFFNLSVKITEHTSIFLNNIININTTAKIYIIYL